MKKIMAVLAGAIIAMIIGSSSANATSLPGPGTVQNYTGNTVTIKCMSGSTHTLYERRHIRAPHKWDSADFCRVSYFKVNHDMRCVYDWNSTRTTVYIGRAKPGHYFATRKGHLYRVYALTSACPHQSFPW